MIYASFVQNVSLVHTSLATLCCQYSTLLYNIVSLLHITIVQHSVVCTTSFVQQCVLSRHRSCTILFKQYTPLKYVLQQASHCQNTFDDLTVCGWLTIKKSRDYFYINNANLLTLLPFRLMMAWPFLIVKQIWTYSDELRSILCLRSQSFFS